MINISDLKEQLQYILMTMELYEKKQESSREIWFFCGAITTFLSLSLLIFKVDIFDFNFNYGTSFLSIILSNLSFIIFLLTIDKTLPNFALHNKKNISDIQKLNIEQFKFNIYPFLYSKYFFSNIVKYCKKIKTENIEFLNNQLKYTIGNHIDTGSVMSDFIKYKAYSLDIRLFDDLKSELLKDCKDLKPFDIANFNNILITKYINNSLIEHFILHQNNLVYLIGKTKLDINDIHLITSLIKEKISKPSEKTIYNDLLLLVNSKNNFKNKIKTI